MSLVLNDALINEAKQIEDNFLKNIQAEGIQDSNEVINNFYGFDREPRIPRERMNNVDLIWARRAHDVLLVAHGYHQTLLQSALLKLIKAEEEARVADSERIQKEIDIWLTWDANYDVPQIKRYLLQDHIRRMPRLKMAELADDDICAICHATKEEWDLYNDGHPIRTLCCRELFHSICLSQWHTVNEDNPDDVRWEKCPKCRFHLTKDVLLGPPPALPARPVESPWWLIALRDTQNDPAAAAAAQARNREIARRQLLQVQRRSRRILQNNSEKRFREDDEDEADGEPPKKRQR